MSKRHTVEKISTFLFLFLSLLVLIGFIPIRFGVLSGIAEHVLKSAGADSVTVGGVSVTLWTGVHVHDAEAYKRISPTEDYRVRVHRADISCNMFRFGVMMLVSPNMLTPGRDMFREVYEKPLELVSDASVYAMSLGPFKKIAFRGAAINFTDKGSPGLSMAGASANIRRRGGASRSLGGDAHAKEVVIPALAKVENFHIKLLADRDRLELVDGGGSIFGGKVSAGLSLDLKESLVRGGKVRVKGLDLEKFCKGTGFAPGRMAGKVNADAVVSPGTPAILDSIRAKGSLSVTRLSAVDIALQRTPAVAQVSGDLRTLLFAQVTGEFEMGGGRFTFSELAGLGDVLKFRSAGWIGFDGRLNHNFEGEFSPQFISGLPRLVRNSLEPADNGGGRFKCRITGTIERPRVDIDRSVYNRALRNLFK